MIQRPRRTIGAWLILMAVVLSVGWSGSPVHAAEPAGPTMLDPNLGVRTVASGLAAPTTMAFLGHDDLLVLEKATGRVQRIRHGVVHSTVLDLAVNSGSERGLLGIARHRSLVYLYWTESSTGADTAVLGETPLLGNRVDRYVWNGSTLRFDRNLLRLRAIQEDANQPPRGNHDGGVLSVGRDGRLYVFVGDLGRRGHLQNLPCGPTATCPGPTVPDDQFGGPAADNAHLGGVVLRLNGDGTAPHDNPFFRLGARVGGEVGANLQRIFSYGHRNGFGMTIHPWSGEVWLQENGDDTFSEINRVTAGLNGGWIQVAGPLARVAQFKEIETTFGGQNLQQLRWPPANIADTPRQAFERLYRLPGSHYRDPEFSWKWEVAPGGIGFLNSWALGSRYAGDLFVGAATPLLNGGYLFRFNMSGHGRRIDLDDPRLTDRVADNLAKHEITESESLLIGTDFGVISDIETGPNGNLFVVSLSTGTVYEIYRRR